VRVDRNKVLDHHHDNNATHGHLDIDRRFVGKAEKTKGEKVSAWRIPPLSPSTVHHDDHHRAKLDHEMALLIAVT